MSSAFLKLVASTFAIFLFTLGNAQSSTLTINFEATDVSIANGNPFATLGIGLEETVTGSFMFDTLAAPLSLTTSGTGTTETDFATRPYISYSAQVGTVTLIGATPPSTIDSIEIQDGIGSDTGDAFVVITDTNTPVPLTGAILEFMILTMNGSLSTFNGTAVPSVAELNSFTGISVLDFSVQNADGSVGGRVRYNSITFSEETSVVPLPAALPLFAGGLGLLGLLGWRRKRVVAA